MATYFVIRHPVTLSVHKRIASICDGTRRQKCYQIKRRILSTKIAQLRTPLVLPH